MSGSFVDKAGLDAEVPGAGFERAKRRLGLFVGPVLAAVAAWAGRDGASPELVALIVLCVSWWISEALPPAVVALAAAVGAVLLGLAPPKVAFSAFGNPLLFLFVGSFFLAEALKRHGLAERLAEFMSRRASGRLSLMVAVSITTFVLSMIMSNSAATAIVLPIALSMAGGADRKYAAALVLAVAWGASVGGVGTPVGTPPNLIGIAQLEKSGVSLGFVEWMSVGVPVGLVMLVALLVVLAWFFGVRVGQTLPPRTARPHAPWSSGEIAVVFSMGLAIVGWLLPTLLQLVAGGGAAHRWAQAHLTEEVVALLAGGLLFVWPTGTGVHRRPALTWQEATHIEWGVILLFGGGILLGDLAKSTGLAAEWGTTLVGYTGASSTWAITALCTGVAIVLSEATSNTATATLMAPLAGSLAASAGAAPIPAILGATLGASFGFMLPISTAPNALAYATGRVTIGQMMRCGIIFDVVGFFLIVGGLWILCPLLGWA
jgi:sodium-dependent dicarboxylate transporter 2/3/5